MFRATCILALVAVTPLAAQTGFKQQITEGAVAVPRGDLFIQNADALWTANDTIYRNVSILIRGGIIRAIGQNLRVPNGITVVDASGFTMIPGFVDEHAHIAMRATNECTAPVVPEVRVIDALDTEQFGIYRALAGGVTTAQVLHGSCNQIGGQSAIIKTRWGVEDPRQLLVQGAPQTVKFALGENVTRKSWQQDRPRFPQSREGVEAAYIEAFTAAQEYKKVWDAYRANPRAQRVPPRRDFRLEALVDIMEGRIRVHAHSYRSDEIVMLMRVAERFGFKIDTFTHVLEGYKVADELREHGAGASTFSDWWMYKLEAYDATPYNAAIMHQQGVKTSLNSDSEQLQAFFQYEISKPVKYGGVSREEALRMLTRYPAEQLLIGDKVGTVQVGKHADLVMLSGDPFDVYTRVERTIVDGIVYYDRAREAELRGLPVRPIAPADLVPQVTPNVSPDATAARVATNGTAMGTNGANGVQSAVTALVGGTVHPVSGPAIANGVVLMEAGRITAVGTAATVAVPAGATRVDVRGKHVYPGMINPITQVGMVEIGQVAASRDDQEVGRFNPHIRALAGVHPHAEAIPVVRANGITSVLAIQSSGVIQGMGSAIQLDGDTPEKMAIRDRAALVVNFPSPRGKAWEDPKLEGEQLEELMQLFKNAGQFAQRPSAVDQPTAPFEPNSANRHRLMFESLVPALRGEVPVYFRARTERDIRTLFLFLDEFPALKPVLVEGDQAFRVAKQLAERRIPVILTHTADVTMDRDDPVTAAWENAAVLQAAGVRVVFGTNDVEHARNLPYHAARAAAFGLPREEALKGVTQYAAEVMGLGAEGGTLDAGKRADVIVTDGDPLQIVTQVERAFIAGREVSLESRHTRLWKAFRER